MSEISLDQFSDKNKKRLDMLIRRTGLSLFNRVIKLSPVGDPDLWKVNQGKPIEERRGPAGYVGGRFRGNWRCSLSAPDTSTSENRSLAKTLEGVNDTTSRADRHDTLWLSNSLPYAYRLEYEGHSSQAPNGMVRRSAAAIKRIISAELRKLKK